MNRKRNVAHYESRKSDMCVVGTGNENGCELEKSCTIEEDYKQSSGLKESPFLIRDLCMLSMKCLSSWLS